MKKIWILWFSVLVYLVCFFSQVYTVEDTGLKLKILASVYPLMEFAQAVSGERGEVSLLLPPGAEIHSWKPKPSDLIKLISADLFIYVGANLEPWISEILQSLENPSLKVMEASKKLVLMREEHQDHGAVDPHVWLDFGNDQIIIDRIADMLSKIYPSGTKLFRQNADTYKRQLHELDQNYKRSLEECHHRTIVLGGHAAFGYLAKRYKLHQISLYGLSPDSKPTPKQMVEVIDFVRERGIKAIFFEVNISDELARVIADETGARTLVLNPGVSLSKQQLVSGINFLDIMEENLENLKDGLVCR